MKAYMFELLDVKGEVIYKSEVRYSLKRIGDYAKQCVHLKKDAVDYRILRKDVKNNIFVPISESFN